MTRECPCQWQPGYSELGCICLDPLTPFQQTEAELNEALHLIKLHIGPEETAQNRNLHNAVQLIVTAARKYHHLERKPTKGRSISEL